MHIPGNSRTEVAVVLSHSPAPWLHHPAWTVPFQGCCGDPGTETRSRTPPSVEEAHGAELGTLACAAQLGRGKWLNVSPDSRAAFCGGDMQQGCSGKSRIVTSTGTMFCGDSDCGPNLTVPESVYERNSSAGER